VAAQRVQRFALVELVGDAGALGGVRAVDEQEVGAHYPAVLAERRPEVQAARQERGVQVLVQVGHPRGRAGGVRELAGEPGPLLDLGEQVGNVDPRRESIELGAQPDRGRGLVERLRWQSSR
jgi:hypothetical protein